MPFFWNLCLSFCSCLSFSAFTASKIPSVGEEPGFKTNKYHWQMEPLSQAMGRGPQNMLMEHSEIQLCPYQSATPLIKEDQEQLLDQLVPFLCAQYSEVLLEGMDWEWGCVTSPILRPLPSLCHLQLIFMRAWEWWFSHHKAVSSGFRHTGQGFVLFQKQLAKLFTPYWVARTRLWMWSAFAMKAQKCKTLSTSNCQVTENVTNCHKVI